MEEKLLQMKSLVERLNQASDSYYNGKGELMTDYEWDALFDQLKRLEEETGEILPDSPTNRVSEDSIVGKKEEHEFAALTLAHYGWRMANRTFVGNDKTPHNLCNIDYLRDNLIGLDDLQSGSLVTNAQTLAFAYIAERGTLHGGSF